ncbi:hypothetical protein [Haloparvum sedimenti]|uniref:hypothetical protein n=1 Tax=Haloparvum sedimenti TaxID=1678448 RepID=UPI00071E88F7|nr:hypothetical protein [Haloparvum sedimenti]
MAETARVVLEVVGILFTLLLVLIQLAARSVTAEGIELLGPQRTVLSPLVVAMVFLLIAGATAGLEASQSLAAPELSIAVLFVVGALFAIAVSGVDAAVAVAESADDHQQTLDDTPEMANETNGGDA